MCRWVRRRSEVCVHSKPEQGYSTATMVLVVPLLVGLMDMWQSQIEIENYSITYFECIATSAKGGAHLCFIDA